MSVDPLSFVRAKQRRASNPQASAWVSANAGSGKTHVLTQRVVRLLLSGVQPNRLVCLTFTRAAAANMTTRVFDLLAKWALLDDDALREAILDTGATPPRDLDEARRLFARAVETPGGLKIQTIHAFCERLLHLFPFEAGAPAGFRVLEDIERAELMAQARTRALSAAVAGEGPLAAAMQILAEETAEGGFRTVVTQALQRPQVLLDERALESLRAALDLRQDDSVASLSAQILDDGFGPATWPGLIAAFEAGSPTDCEQAAKLKQAQAHYPGEEAVQAYLSIFLTGGKVRKRVATQTVGDQHPDLPAQLQAEAARVLDLHDKLLAARAYRRTSALILIARDILRHYDTLKRLRAVLDFDDLIAQTRRLLSQHNAASWVMYKLDGGVDHILVDEAQDTSRAQWEILEALEREFSSGAGRNPRPRTFFAVGDEKQSIFSFQGAEPAAFAENRHRFQKRIQGAGAVFEPVTLDQSFRSAPTILAAVDAVATHPAVIDGLRLDRTEGLPRHIAVKGELQGLVEIWPPMTTEEAPPPESWVLPLDLPREDSGVVRLARKIAQKIGSLTNPNSLERVAGKNGPRAISPGDIMILVRRRDAFFEAMVRALKEAGIPVAGADRLSVADHIAVLDLVAAARAALAPDDDLSLANVLKSPLCGLDDDDLIALAPQRGKHSLWWMLRQSVEPRHQAVAEKIANWRKLAGLVRPYDFFMRLLGPERGRHAMLARLGPEANDAIDELLALALAHERQEAPSLAAFAQGVEALSLTVKRDMEAAGGQVRVMTAHAAKGLEAKVVFMPDTCSKPSRNNAPKIFDLAGPQGETLIWAPRKKDDPAIAANARAASERATDDEYRRLLYVAMTRAEERLYIAGHCSTKPVDGSWYPLMLAALKELSEEFDDPLAAGQKILRMGEGMIAFEKADAEAAGGAPAPFPAWLYRPAPVEREAPPPLRPSSALAGADSLDEREAQLPETRAAHARETGLLIHALLQYLPQLAAEARAQASADYLSASAPFLTELERANVASAALATLAAPQLAALFGEHSRAEVALAASLARPGAPPRELLGRIDRLAEVGDEIWFADFKTGAPHQSVAYIGQMALYGAALAALYPGRRQRAFLVWTQGPHIEEIAHEQLESALAAL
ncbi:MAG: double-strand break repair helicase AddA [Hyphomicrobiales bacterium]|nr:double-strand break repair helicase AddA [Hyphomicrobiales bacterium]